MSQVLFSTNRGPRDQGDSGSDDLEDELQVRALVRLKDLNCAYCLCATWKCFILSHENIGLS